MLGKTLGIYIHQVAFAFKFDKRTLKHAKSLFHINA